MMKETLELEPKLKCRYCPEVFVLFEDLQGHFYSQHESVEVNYADLLGKVDKKIESFESLIEKKLLTEREINEIMLGLEPRKDEA